MGAETWDTVAGDAKSVAALLAQGNEIGPVRVTVGRSERFFSADWLFLDIRRPAALAAQLLAHEFTSAHAGIVWLASESDGGSGEARLLIGFPSDVTIVDAAQYRMLLKGLSTIYGEGGTPDVFQSWRVTGDGDATVLGGVLGVEVLHRLELVGRESRKHAGKETKGFLRSAVRLNDTQAIALPGGELAQLTMLAEGTRVRCPIHIDPLCVAQVLGGSRAKAVQCPVCQRNYWSSSPLRAIDFGHFRRVFGELHAQGSTGSDDSLAKQFVMLRERFFPALNFQTGITLIRSPMGTGKTEGAVSLVEECKARGLSVLVIGHRRSLLRTVAQRLGLDLYFEIVADDEGASQFRAIAVTDGYAISLDSVPTRLQPDVHKFDVIIVDEAEQVIRHLAGGTLKEKRRLAFETFGHYVRVASAVYLLDAHLDTLTLSFVLRTVDPSTAVRFIVNEPPVELRQYELMPTRESVLGKLAAAVAAGEKCYVATNSKNRAIATALWLQEHWPDRRVVAVTHDNAQQPKVQDLLGNLTEEFQTGRDGEKSLDVLIGSPAIGTGIDITFNGGAVGVDQVFGIFEAGITTHFDVDQQLARVRNPGRVSVWISPETLNFETAPEAVLRELQNTVARTDVHVAFDRGGLPIFSDHDRPYIELWSEIAATERTSKNALIDNWTALRERDGWVAIVGESGDDEQARGAAAMAEGKQLREADLAQRIVGAGDIDDMDGQRIDDLNKKGALLTTQELAELEKWHLREFYVQPVDEALIAFDDGARTRRHVEMLEIMVGDAALNRKIDIEQIDRDGDQRVIAFDRKFRTAKAEILGRLLVSAGLLEAGTGAFNVDAELRTDGLADFVAAYIADKKRIQSELGLDMRRDIEKKPVQQLGQVLNVIGASVVLSATIKTKGVKQRSYRIDGDKVVALMDVVARRADRRRDRWEARHGEDGDNAPPDDLETVQKELSPDGGHDEVCDYSAEHLQSRPPQTDALALAVSERKAQRSIKQPAIASRSVRGKWSIADISLNL